MNAGQLADLIDGHAAALVLFARQWCAAPEDVVRDAFGENCGRRRLFGQLGAPALRGRHCRAARKAGGKMLEDLTRDPLLQNLARFTPATAGIDRDAMLFAAGRASAPKPYGWKL